MAEPGEEFTFKQALLRGKISVRVDKKGVTVTRGGGKQRAEFANVKAIFVHVPADMDTRAVEITTTSGKRIRYTTTAVATSKDSQVEFYRSTTAILRAYANAFPGAQAHLGTSRHANIGLMAIIGVASLGIWLVQALWDRQIDTMDWILLPVWIGAIGWVALTRFRVLKEPPLVSASDLAAALKQAADPLVS